MIAQQKTSAHSLLITLARKTPNIGCVLPRLKPVSRNTRNIAPGAASFTIAKYPPFLSNSNAACFVLVASLEFLVVIQNMGTAITLRDILKERIVRVNHGSVGIAGHGLSRMRRAALDISGRARIPKGRAPHAIAVVVAGSKDWHKAATMSIAMHAARNINIVGP
jgi:hypothetical protein